MLRARTALPHAAMRVGFADAAFAGVMNTLCPEDAEAQSGFKWNPYALGTIAFLQGDREALERPEKALSQAAQDRDSTLRTKALARRGQCFDQPCRAAYACR